MKEGEKIIGKLVITKVKQVNPDYPPPGKTYTIYSWVCDVTFNGTAFTDVPVKTMSKNVKALVKDGFSFDQAEGSNFRGVDQYFLPKEAAGVSTGGGYGGGGSGYSKAPVTHYTREELEALYKWALSVSHAALHEVMGAELTTGQDVQAGAATLVIAAQKCGLK